MGNYVTPTINAEMPIPWHYIEAVQKSKFYGKLNENPHKHLTAFAKLVSAFHIRGVSNEQLKCMLFPHSLADLADQWFTKLPLEERDTWDKVCTKFADKFFTTARVIKMRADIQSFRQKE